MIKLTAEDAVTRLRIATALAVDWAHFARMELPPRGTATDAEKVADLTAVLSGACRRRDQARSAMIAEYGPAMGDLSLSELWTIHDAHDARSLRILPYLHWESYAAALEAMLWWQQRPHDQGRRFITLVNRQLRAMGYVEAGRAAA